MEAAAADLAAAETIAVGTAVEAEAITVDSISRAAQEAGVRVEDLLLTKAATQVEAVSDRSQ